MNDWSVKEELKKLNPELVMFDRFILEEQFGPMVYEVLPDALVVMETQDLHFVRRAREQVRERFLEMEEIPSTFYRTETAIRETAAIERVDFSFLVSSFEEKLLKEQFEFGVEKQAWIPFFYDKPWAGRDGHFSDRSEFVWVGNFRHSPNIDGLRWFLKEIWPGVRERLPDAHLRIHGAYPSAEVMAWHQPEAKGVSVLGSAATLDDIFETARVNLAPLRFGAGVKGKILEGFRYGVPVVCTSIGQEGILPIGQEGRFPGLVSNQVDGLIHACVELYTNETLWRMKQRLARPMMEEFYSKSRAGPGIIAALAELSEKKKQGVFPTWRSRMLRHELMAAGKYFSKWIELKEKGSSPK
jgi:glycosyltransferase involved in cell wall biosynthesis